MNLFKRLAGVCAVLLFAVLSIGAPAVAATTPIANVAQLNTAFAKTAQPGDTLALACGDYVMPNLQGRHFTPPIVITSADPNCRAVLRGLKLANASGVTFSGLELASYTAAGPVDPYYAFRMGGCAQISFDHDYVHGDPALVPSVQINGFYPNTCTGLSFSDDTFENLNAAINAQTITGLHVKDSLFTGAAKGGMEIGGSSDIEIVDNLFTNFQTGAGVHGDAIQVFTANTKVAASGILVAGNLITRGSGVPVQGIFIQDEAGNLPFNNVGIVDNAVIGGEWNSIMVSHAVGSVVLVNNIAASWAGPDPVKVNPDGSFGTTNFTGYIRLDRLDPTLVTVLTTGNCAQQWIREKVNAPPPGGNTVCAAVTDGGAALEAAWRAAHPAYPTGTIH